MYYDNLKLIAFHQFSFLAFSISSQQSNKLATKINTHFDFAEAKSYQTQNTVAPSFLAIERAYLALFFCSSSSSPFCTISQLMALGSIPEHKCM